MRYPETIAIVAILLVMSYFFLRRGKRATSVVILGLLVLPLAHLGALAMYNRGLPPSYAIAADAAGLLLALLLVLFNARRLSNPEARRSYLLIFMGFNLVLAGVMVLQLFSS